MATVILFSHTSVAHSGKAVLLQLRRKYFPSRACAAVLLTVDTLVGELSAKCIRLRPHYVAAILILSPDYDPAGMTIPPLATDLLE